MFRIDLHTHSTDSPDGGIKLAQYKKALEKGLLDFIAITDHNHIKSAFELHALYGEKIIIGEEIMTTEGEIIGLYLNQPIEPGASAMITARAIKEQGGLVYLPHPFETIRKGVSISTANKIAKFVDIVEVHNGRAFIQNKGPQASSWATLHQKARAVSSDAHGLRGLGHSYTIIDEEPTAENLVKLLTNHNAVIKRPPVESLLYPKFNYYRHKIIGRKSQ